MADEAVDFLLENLNRLLIYHPHLILGDAMDQIKKLEPNLLLFKAFLRNTTTTSRKQETVRDLICQIQDAVYQAEDIIDGVVTQAVDSKTRNYFLRAFQTKKNSELLSVAKHVESIGRKVRDTYTNEIIDHFANINIRDEEPQAPGFKKYGVVGVEDELEVLMDFLTQETDHLDIVSIIGMPGLGKTTLASKVFHHPTIKYQFRTRIWICVSMDFMPKNVFLAILREFTSLTEDMYCKSDGELAKLAAAYLERKKFLIVMDDVWGAEDWNKLKYVLPKSNKMGKVLITSRNAEVGQCANRNRYPHSLRFLTSDESWLLLQLEIFSKPECPLELEVVGKVIASVCKGLPLAIVIIGGILAKISSASDEMSATKNEWRKVSQSVTKYLNMESGGRSMENIISLSYDGLPYHLRTCFLYLGMFPEDLEIPVWKLIRMWIAEGFIQQKAGLDPEETAESYLEDLISRNLVTIDKTSLSGRVNTCRIHDVLRDFCKTKAERENFLQEIDKSTSDGYAELHRRLCIHSDVLNFISSKPYGPHVRSFVCFSKDEISFPTENISTIPAAFKLLRVLDTEPIKFTRIPSELYQLVHLRYLALSFIKVAVLPVAFVKLWNLETLIFNTRSRTLEIKADIFLMVHLRHLKTNASATLLKKGESNTQGEKLQTLGTISPESCTEEVFDRACNLKKLSVRGRLALLLHDENGSFSGLWKLGNLEKLKLLNDMFSGTLSEGQLHGLPPPQKFPPRLRSLTLSDTFLDWSHMSILGMLDNLECLKLKHKAFMGRCWEAVDGGFRRLEVLYIGRTNLVSWIASGCHFPRLRRLELRNCEELQEVPLGFADIPSFELLDLHRSKSAAASAKKIYETRRAKQNEQTAKISEFKLSIFPPDD